MTPKEEAISIIYDFWEVEPLANFDGDNGYYSSQCALIAVEKILDVLYDTGITDKLEGAIDYYILVKQEIITYKLKNGKTT